MSHKTKGNREVRKPKQAKKAKAAEVVEPVAAAVHRKPRTAKK